MPGSPADAAIAKLSQSGPLSPATRAAVEAQLGVSHGNWWTQYTDYLGNVIRLRFGVSYTFFPQSVSDLVAGALPWTVVMVGLVTIVAFVIGSLVGVAAAWRRGTRLDTLPTLSGAFLSAFPYFWTALLLLFFLGYVQGWFPTSGAYSADATPHVSWGFLTDALQHALLPALTILITSVGGGSLACATP
jgi:peptide/nickel transport system permease protein